MCTVDKMLIKGIRSFSPENTNVIEFYRPLTLIVGANGAGKTTVIECLKQACTGELPPNTRSGQSFVHDPKVAHETEVKAQIKLRFITSSGQPVVVVRSFQLSQKKAALQFKTLDSILQTINAETGEKQAVTYRCVDIDKMVPSLMGVSKAVLENVIFVHQEESNWPLAEGKVLKDKFDDIFAATKYTKALESLSKLRKEKAQEVKEKRLGLDHTRTHKQTAQKLQEDVDKADAEIQRTAGDAGALEAQIRGHKATAGELQGKVQQLSDLRQEVSVREARLEELNKQAALKRTQCDVDEFEESPEEVQQLLNDHDQHMQKIRARQNRLANDIKTKKLEVGNVSESHARDMMRHGQLAAERAAHEANLVDRDKYMAQVASAQGLPLPTGVGAPGAHIASDEVVSSFSRALGARVAELEGALKALKEGHRARDDDAGRRVDAVTAAITRNSGELRVKQEQAATNMATIDNLAAQQEAVVVNERSLAEAEAHVAAVEDRLRAKHVEQANSKFDEKLAAQKRELEEISASITSLRAERDRVAAASEAVTRLRLKRAELADKEEGLTATLRARRTKLQQLLGLQGVAAELPPVENLKSAVDSALATRREEVAARRKEAAEASERESSAKGQISAARVALAEAQASSEALMKELVAGLAAMGSPTEFLTLPGWQTVLEEEMSERKRELESRKGHLHRTEAILAQFNDMHNLICAEKECPMCLRGFASQAELETCLQKVEEQGTALPQRKTRQAKEVADAEVAVGELAKLQPAWRKLAELQGGVLAAAKDKVAALERVVAEAMAAATEAAEEMAMVDTELREHEAFAAEVVWGLDRTARDVVTLRREVSVLEASQVATQSGLGGGAGMGPPRSLAELDNELDDLDVARVNKENEREATLKKGARVKEDVLGLMQELAAAKDAAAGAKARMARKQELRNKVEELEAASRTLAAAIAALQVEAAPLAAQREELTRARTAQRAAMQVEEDAAEARVREARKQSDGLEAKLRPIREYLGAGKASELEAVARALERSQARIAALNTEVEELEGQARQEQTSLSEQETLRRKMQDFIELHKVEAQRGAQQAEIEQLLVLQADIGDEASLQADLKAALSAAAGLQSQLDMLSGAKAAQEAARARAVRELSAPQYLDIASRYAAAYAEVTYLEMANADLDKYHKALEKALLSFHATKMGDINKIIKELWQKTYRGQDIDYIQIKADADGARSYNYRVVMYSGGAELEMRGRCSAGQKVLACLIIRLALAETFCLNCGILALDEPTTNLDADNSASLAEALRAIMHARKEQENFQLIVITHDESFAHLIGTRTHADYLWRITKDEAQYTHLAQEEIADQ